jgi:hypothetical protein
MDSPVFIQLFRRLLPGMFICAVLFSNITIVQAAPVTVAGFELNGLLGSEATFNATTNDVDLETVTLSRGAGISPSALGNAFSASSFVVGGLKANAISSNEFFQVTIQPRNGMSFSLQAINFNLRRSGTGPNAYQWQYSLDGFATTGTDVGAEGSYTGTGTNGAAMTPIDLSSVTALQNIPSGSPVTFRLYAWGATGAPGTIAFGRLAGNDLEFIGESGPGNIVAFEEAGQPGDQASHGATTLNASIASATLTRGSGLNPSGLLNAFSSNGYFVAGTKTNAIQENDFIQIHIPVKDGFRMSLSEMNYVIRRSAQGPMTFQWQYSLDEFSTSGTDLGSEITYSGTDDLGVTQTSIPLSGLLPLQGARILTLRLYAWGATSSNGTFALGRQSGPDFELSGTVSPNIILGFDANTLSGNESLFPATFLNTQLLSTQVSRGVGIDPTLASNSYASVNFLTGATSTNAVTNDEYYQFHVQSQTGYYITLTNLFQTNLRTFSGPTTYQWQYSLNEFATPGIILGTPQVYTGTDANGRTATTTAPADVPTLQNVTSVSLRMYAWGASATTGTFSYGRLTGNDLSLSGEVTIFRNFITYSAGDGGVISGSSTQYIDYNSSTIAVTATPFTLNQFSHWSDGRTDNPRQDYNVTTTQTYTAYFKARQATSTGGGGSFIPPKGIGRGKRDVTVEIDKTQTIGEVDEQGINFLAKIRSTGLFTLDDAPLAEHAIQLVSVDLNVPRVVLRFNSMANTQSFALGDSRTIDLNSDGIADISATFAHVYINRIEITLKKLHQKTLLSERVSPGFRFTRELKTGSLGDDVKALQLFLNSNGFLVAASGPGSKGKETTRFGAGTREALRRYQKTHGIRATGILGPLSRAHIQANSR